MPVTEAEQAPRGIRRTWAHLIRKIYEVDPLRCTLCGAMMKVINVIEDEDVIYPILCHLNLRSSWGQPMGPTSGGPSPASASSALTPSISFPA